MSIIDAIVLYSEKVEALENKITGDSFSDRSTNYLISEYAKILKALINISTFEDY